MSLYHEIDRLVHKHGAVAILMALKDSIEADMAVFELKQHKALVTIRDILITAIKGVSRISKF